MDPVISKVLQTMALTDDELFEVDAATCAALASRVAAALQPAPTSGPPTAEREPPPELRVLCAPRAIRWPDRAAFPLLLAERRSNLREWAVHSQQNRLALISNLSSGAVDVVSLLDHGRRMPRLPPSGSGDAPDSFQASLASVGVQQRDLLKWVAADRLIGRLAVTMLDYDLTSNAAMVDVSGETPPAAPAAVAGAGVTVQAEEPQASLEEGVTLDVVAAAEGPPTLRATVSLTADRVATVAGDDEQRPILAAALVLVELDDPSPVKVDLAVDGRLNQGQIEAAFSLSLSSELAQRLARSDNWLAYLAAGDALSAPRPLAGK